MNKKISFVIPIHDEEKFIHNTLSTLLKIPYDNYDILIGLDGCTDNSESLVKMFATTNKKIKVYTFKERRGKNGVINDLINDSNSDIIIIHDIDWIFDWKDKETLSSFISIFDNPEIGGIAESFPITWPLRKDMPTLEMGITVHSKMWIDYLKDKGIPWGEWVLLNKKEYPMLVNIFRRDLYKNNNTLGDDFERCVDIWGSNKLILAAKEDKWPRMISAGEEYSFGGLLKQKERTALAREQLDNKLGGRKLGGWNLITYTIDHLKDYEEFPNARRGFNLVSLIFLLGTIKSKFKRKNVTTSKGWQMRGR